MGRERLVLELSGPSIIILLVFILETFAGMEKNVLASIQKNSYDILTFKIVIYVT